MVKEKSVLTEPKPGDDRWGVSARPAIITNAAGSHWVVKGGGIKKLMTRNPTIPEGAVLVTGHKKDKGPILSHEPKTDGQMIVEPRTRLAVLDRAQRVAGKKV